MSMSLGSGRGFRADINMTPMIDVLLVLIIIFMVITPTTSRGLQTLLPQPRPDSPTARAAVNDDVVVTVNGDRTVEINQVPVPIAALYDRLREIFRANPSHVVFVRGGKDLQFHHVAEVIDIARAAGLNRVALMTR